MAYTEKFILEVKDYPNLMFSMTEKDTEPNHYSPTDNLFSPFLYILSRINWGKIKYFHMHPA